MGKHLLATLYIGKLINVWELRLTTLTSSTGNETTMGILKWHGSQAMSMVSMQRKLILEIQRNSY
jgi:hypothetical protein